MARTIIRSVYDKDGNKICAECGVLLPSYRKHSRCKKCRKDHVCIECNVEKVAWHNQKCDLCKIEPTRRIIRKGYVMVLDKTHHRAQANGYVYEHIVIMEEKLGRKLIVGENVHHINGVKDDNSPNNLELWLVSQPPGQRVEDKIRYAMEILERYAPDKLRTGS